MTKDTGISRRGALAGLAGSAALLVGDKPASAASPPATANPASAAVNVCRMTPRMVEGPFYFDPDLVREDITEGLAAAPGAFCRLMRGDNFGKALVRVSAEHG